MPKRPNIKLIPCPFCGSEEVQIFSPSVDGKWLGYRYPTCTKCHARIGGTKFKTFRQAAEAWNRRASIWLPVSALRAKYIFHWHAYRADNPHLPSYHTTSHTAYCWDEAVNKWLNYAKKKGFVNPWVDHVDEEDA